MFSTGRLQLPPAGLAIKVALAVVLFVLIVEIFSNTHPISDRLLPQAKKGPELITHGNDRCLPRADSTMGTLALQLRQSCAESSPHKPARGRIGVVTAQFGEPQEYYGKALETHHLHSMIHSTELHVMCEPMIDDLWNKPAFILALLLDEMLKPATQRLEWIFWVDRDTVILDQCRPVSSFLPPIGVKTADGRDINFQTHLLATKDGNGLNNGIFLMSVSHWSINLLMDILAYRDFKPEVELVFTEQSAMENVLREPKFAPNVQYVPQEWFNAYPNGGPKEFLERKNEDGLEHEHVRRGDFLVHFAGNGDKPRALNEWTALAKTLGNLWVNDNEIQRDYTGDIERMWNKLKEDRIRTGTV